VLPRVAYSTSNSRSELPSLFAKTKAAADGNFDQLCPKEKWIKRPSREPVQKIFFRIEDARLTLSFLKTIEMMRRASAQENRHSACELHHKLNSHKTELHHEVPTFRRVS
jgi:hypothetical protein